MIKRVLAISILLLVALQLMATHYRAGEITYRQVGQLTYEATVTTYTTDINLPPDSDTIRVHWGDGSSDLFTRQPINGTPLGNNIKENVYKGPNHTYAGALPFYLIYVEDPNRINGIINVNGGFTVGFAFYIEDTIRIYDPAFLGMNSSPVLLNPPIDFANVGSIFRHNPAAFDPDGDSLTFELINPKGANGSNLPLYVDPDLVSPLQDDFTIDINTGEIEWVVPQSPGTYNIAILITEYRNGIKLGTILRDMQIIVLPGVPNQPPVISKIKDTCVVAGTLLTIPVDATDPNASQILTLTAVGGPFTLPVSPAQFTSTPGLSPVSGSFEWRTDCNHVRLQDYQVIFKAKDNYQGPGNNNPQPLADLETWIIKVVAPAPEDLVAEAQGDNIRLAWRDPYDCDFVSQFIGFSVWRREGTNPFVIDTCQPGLNGRGYTKIADFVNDFEYVDSTAVRGREYCYRILGEFAERTTFGLFYNKVSSLPSNEACENLNLDVPVITNVSVNTTDATNGRMLVTWSKPKVGGDNLDTLQFPGPYTYRLLRTDGFFSATSTYIEVASFTSNDFAGHNDTTYVDTLLNTVSQPYSYLIEFYANGGDLLGTSDAASSVFLSIQPTDNQLDLSWEEQVPWVNTKYEVLRLNPLNGNFELIDTTEDQEYRDNTVLNDSLYCYQVRSIGGYPVGGVLDPIINLSQEACERPIDDQPPCAPVLIVTNNCNEIVESESCVLNLESSSNQLRWSIPQDLCPEDIVKYYIYFGATQGEPLEIIDSTLSIEDSSYSHSNNGSLAGCYAITAIDANGNESEVSNVFCIDNCPCYKLPNVFTPNGDDQNDVFTPILPYLFVERVDMKIYDRWGALVFETDNPDILWDGTDVNNNKDAKEGVYYYSCIVYEQRIDGVQRGQEVLTGFIHLIRGNGSLN